MLKKIAGYGFLSLFFCTMLWVSLAALGGASQSSLKILIVSCCLCGFFTLLYRIVLCRADALAPQVFRLCVAMLFTIFTLALIVIGCYTMTYPVSDLEVLCNAVAQWVEQGEILYYSYYFTICSNTLANCIFLYFIFKPLSYFGLYMGSNAAECVAIVINVLMIVLAVYLLYRIFTRLSKHQGHQLLFLILSMSFAPFYLWAHRYYSDTLSMPFAPLAIWLFLRATQTSSRTKQLTYGVATGICLWVGYCLKGSVLIALPALLIFAVFTQHWRTVLRFFVPLICAMALCSAGWNLYRHNNNWISYENEAYDNFPATMWLLYGAHGDGNYADEDVTYLKTFETYEARSIAAKERLIEYYSVYTPRSYLSFLTTKFTATWSNGKFDAENYLVASRGGNWTHYFLIEGMPFYALTNYYCNGWHFAFLGMLLLSTAAALLRPKWDMGFLLRICLFGLVVFLCFWETKARYLLTFAPFFPLFFAQGTLCLDGILCAVLQYVGLMTPVAVPEKTPQIQTDTSETPEQQPDTHTQAG